MPVTLLPQAAKSILLPNRIASWQVLVGRIRKQSKKLEQLNDEQLRKTSLALKYDALSGQHLDDLLVDAFALVREAGRRTLSMQHYDVQLLGGISMHFQNVAVMQTGEGKTLTATLPLYLHALTGKGAHLATANDYLAARDADLMSPIFEALGMSVGVVQSNTARPKRLQAYRSDVTYSTAKEIGFDFLRDRLQSRWQQTSGQGFISSLFEGTDQSPTTEPVQREHNFMLVDEADSILIDEARTPLIVSSIPDEIAKASIALYRWCSEASSQFEFNDHFQLVPESKQLNLTPEGRRLVRKLPKPELLNQTPILDIYEQIELAIYVNQNYFRDRHYVVRDGEVVIVDEFTGRLSEGRKWRSGIHQAIEARENLEISIETGEAARITIQDLFLKYKTLSGMTGTIGNSARELKKIYQTGVVHVPTNKPSQRKQWPDLVFASDSQKWQAIVDEVEAIHKTGRPVLIGTRSIDKSEVLSKLLEQRAIKHEVLNARQLAHEAMIVAAAGRLGHVTVATNMAGRGTDIKVEARALEAGGLHVICSELHESARIDRQLIGRCGRQGDIGSFRQFMSLEDDILKVGFGEKRAKHFLSYARLPAARLQRFSAVFRQAQRKIEKQHFNSRKILLHREKLRSELQIEMGQDPYLDVAGA